MARNSQWRSASDEDWELALARESVIRSLADQTGFIAGPVATEAPLPVWANFRQRALDTAIAEINKKTDLKITLDALERSKHRRVTTLTFSIKAKAVTNGDSKGARERFHERRKVSICT